MAKKKKANQEVAKAQAESVQVLKHVRLHYRTSPDVRLVFANQFTVQSDGNCFYLAFYEAQPPFLLGSPQEIADQLKTLEAVTANCVAKVVIPAGEIPKVLQALQSHVSKKGVIEIDAVVSAPKTGNGQKK